MALLYSNNGIAFFHCWAGIPVELVGPEKRQEAIEKIKRCDSFFLKTAGKRVGRAGMAGEAGDCARVRHHLQPGGCARVRHQSQAGDCTRVQHKLQAVKTRERLGVPCRALGCRPPIGRVFCSKPPPASPSLLPCSEYPDLVLVDYTLPSVLNDNALFYCEPAELFVVTSLSPLVCGGACAAGWQPASAC